METLITLIRNRENIQVIENYMLYDLIVKDNKCFGGRLISMDNMFCNIFATSIILATGGIGAVYKDSTNAHGATGDGIAAAYRAGAKLRGMEFVQFHPTVFMMLREILKDKSFSLVRQYVVKVPI